MFVKFNFMQKGLLVVLLCIIAMMNFSSCTVSPEKITADHKAGLLHGLWAGIIAPYEWIQDPQFEYLTKCAAFHNFTFIIGLVIGIVLGFVLFEIACTAIAAATGGIGIVTNIAVFICEIIMVVQIIRLF